MQTAVWYLQCFQAELFGCVDTTGGSKCFTGNSETRLQLCMYNCCYIKNLWALLKIMAGVWQRRYPPPCWDVHSIITDTSAFPCFAAFAHTLLHRPSTACFKDLRKHGIEMDEIFLLSCCLLRLGDWTSQRETWLNTVSAQSNLKPISRLVQHRNEAVLFSTCLCCCCCCCRSLIDTVLWSAERSASWYKVMPVS